MKKVISLICRFLEWLYLRLVKGSRVELGAWMYWSDPKVVDGIERQASEEQYFTRNRCHMEDWDPNHVWHKSYVDENTQKWDRQVAETIKEYGEWSAFIEAV